MSRLRKRSGKHPVSTSIYKGVLPRVRSADGSCRWQAQAQGVYLGSFATEKSAARAVAKKLKVALGQLLKQKSGRRGVNRKISAARARALFKAAFPAFKKYVAADYASLTDVETRFARLLRQDLHMQS